jgi:ribose 5-phosphate isomerase B
MRVAVGANDRGLAVREQVVPLLQRFGHEVDVVEAPQGRAAEYPEIAAEVGRRMGQGRAERGILIGRSGMGMCIVANKFPGVRAAVCNDEFTADTGRRYLDVNVLCLSADMVGEHSIRTIIEVWLATPAEGGRHGRRIERVSAIEEEVRSSFGPSREI